MTHLTALVEVVTLTPDAAQEVAQLLTLQRAEYVAGFRPFAHDADAIRAALEGARHDVYQGIWCDGALVGLLLLRGWDAGYAMPALGVMVDETYAGTGLADAAIRMALCTARYRGAQTVMLHVDADNARARRCFERHGFVEASRTGPVLRMEAIIVGAHEAETDLRTLYDPDAATVQRGIQAAFGFTPPDAFARAFVCYTQDTSAEVAIDVEGI